MIYYCYDYERWEDTEDDEWFVDMTPETRALCEMTFKTKEEFYQECPECKNA